MAKKIEVSQHSKYTCSFCGKVRKMELTAVFVKLFIIGQGILSPKACCHAMKGCKAVYVVAQWHGESEAAGEVV